MYQKNRVLKKLNTYRKILVTGGCGFIGASLIKRLLLETNSYVYNLDKVNYASDETCIKNIIKSLPVNGKDRYSLFELDLKNEDEVEKIINKLQPNLVIHLAAESHVDRSISGPKIFLESNVIGTFNLLQACTKYYLNSNEKTKTYFRFLHISTDEVFGSISGSKQFSENSQYSPSSPYSASKAASDHLVNAWHYSYGLPVIISNCSNNYGPWQYPEKLIPLAIFNAVKNKKIPLYGNGLNIRDWLFVEDHIDAILSVATLGNIGSKYCIGGNSELTNKEVLRLICLELDHHLPRNKSHSNLITNVPDRKGHDYRYAINNSKIKKELGWDKSLSFKEGLSKTVIWYINNIDWCEKMLKKK